MFSKINSLKHRIPIKHFNIKIKSTIKEASKDEKIEIDYETYDNLPSDKKKAFYEEYRDSIISIDNDQRLRYWYAFHSIPAILFMPNLMNFLWVYQIFWSGTVTGIGMVCYDLYSNESEKTTLDRHIITRYILILSSLLVGLIAIGIGIYYKINQDKRVILAYAANSALLSAILYNKSSKFFIPHWFKNSLASYMVILMVLGLLSITKSSSHNKSTEFDDVIQKVQYRYIKELSGIYN
jgi:hypothetical protein